MAKIKRIAKQSALSNFQQGAPQGGGAFKLLADGLNELYDRVAPVAEKELTQRGESLGREAAKAQFGNDRPYRVEAPTGGGSTDTLAGGAGGDDLGAGGEWLEYANQGATRNKPISGKLRQSMSFLSGLGVKMRVISGGQDGKGEGSRRTGSTRHDHGGAADADFYKDGRKLDWNNPDDLPIFQQIAAQARANGVTGIGAGDDYMGAGRMHLGFGSEAAWGAEGKGENAPDWLTQALNNSNAGAPISGGGGADVLAGGDTGGAPAEYVPPTMVRTSSGALEGRLYSPYSGPLLQAHNTAARVAYQSEVLNKSAVDLMDLSAQFELNPDGYQEAAEQYIDQMVDSAPTDYQGELRGALSKEVQRRAFGMMEEKQRDIRQRANNSSAALVDRWTGTLTEAILTGDPDQISEAQDQLDGLLQAREALPGVAWTVEQSANTILKARKAAQVEMEKRRKKASAEIKDNLNLIIKGAQAGATVSGEDLLNDPSVIAEYPELAREAAANISLRDNMPEFLSMTPDQQAEAVAALASEEIVEEWQLDITAAADKVAKANKKAWDDDPVQQAATVLKNNPPPPMPELTPDDPDKMIQGIAARREYMNQLRADGYTDTGAYFSAQEAEGLQAAMGADSPVELRAAIAGAIVGGFGPDAVKAFDEIDGDKVTMFAGKMMALGGNQALAATILTGQKNIDEGLVRVPSKADRIDKFSNAAAQAFVGAPGGIEAQAEVMAAAMAIYAADPSARGIEPTSEAATALMETSIQKALGSGKNKKGQATGGIQEIMGSQTILPIGVAGDRVNDALEQAMGAKPETFWSKMSRGPGTMADTPDVDLWGDGGPMWNGKPIPKSYARNGGIRIVPFGGNNYRMEIMTASGPKPAEDANGNVYFFDLQKLMDAAE